MADNEHYKAPDQDEEGPKPSFSLVPVSRDSRFRLFFIAPSLLYFLILVLLPLLHRLDFPVPERPGSFGLWLIYAVLAAITSVFSTKYLTSRTPSGRLTSSLIFLSHFILQVVALTAISITLTVAGQIL